jgi:hypothetical protein
VSSASEIFTGRSEGQKAKNLGLALPPAGLVQGFAPNGAASNQTF